uniref:Uncharacterized protein n=1 Tax=Solanum tuberosum TaxID=4113 RepID=M1BC88_SOLTU
MSVGNAFGGSGEADETMEMNSHIRDTASQHSEDTPQVNKSMDLTQEVPNRSENAIIRELSPQNMHFMNRTLTTQLTQP